MTSLKPEIRLKILPAITIPYFRVDEVQSKLAYVDENILSAEVTSSGDLITLQLKPGISPDQQAAIEEKVQKVVVSLAKGTIRPKVQILENHLERRTPFAEDPNPKLLAENEIHQEASGIYTLGPMLTRLIDFFEAQFLTLADSFDAAPYRFPTLIPAKLLERVNYFHAFPHSLTFVTHLREDLDVINHFAEHAACDEHGLNTNLESFDQIKTLLSPAVCYHLYFALADKPLPGGKLAATAVNSCFRYESLNLSSLERMWNFTMREVIFVGPKDYVLENREIARQRMAQFFEQINLAYKVETANDPFFVGEFRKQAAFQSAFQLKFEIRASLPYKNSTLAIGSYNYHQDFFGRHLNISLKDGTPAHTGCVAFGLERVALAFIAQYGFDKNKWPTLVQNAFNE